MARRAVKTGNLPQYFLNEAGFLADMKGLINQSPTSPEFQKIALAVVDELTAAYAAKRTATLATIKPVS